MKQRATKRGATKRGVLKRNRRNKTMRGAGSASAKRKTESIGNMCDAVVNKALLDNDAMNKQKMENALNDQLMTFQEVMATKVPEIEGLYANEIEQLKSDNKKHKNLTSKLEKQNDELERNNFALQNENKKQTKDIETHKQDILKMQKQLKNAEAEEKTLQAENKDLVQKQKKSLAVVEKRVSAENQEMERLENEIEEKNAAITELQKQSDSVIADAAKKLEQQITNSEKTIKQLNFRLQELNMEYTTKEKNQQDELDLKDAEIKDLNSQLLRKNFENGDVQAIKDQTLQEVALLQAAELDLKETKTKTALAQDLLKKARKEKEAVETALRLAQENDIETVGNKRVLKKAAGILTSYFNPLAYLPTTAVSKGGKRQTKLRKVIRQSALKRRPTKRVSY